MLSKQIIYKAAEHYKQKEPSTPAIPKENISIGKAGVSLRVHKQGKTWGKNDAIVMLSILGISLHAWELSSDSIHDRPKALLHRGRWVGIMAGKAFNLL